MFDFFNMADTYEQRKVDHFEKNDLAIDTCAVTDIDGFDYETAIEHPAYNEGAWVIVEQYITKEEAQKGHDKWVKKLTKKLPDKLKDVATNTIANLTFMFNEGDRVCKKK